MVSRIWSLGQLAALVLAGACGGSVEPIVTPPGCPRAPVRGPSKFADEPAVRLLDDFDTRDPAAAPRDGEADLNLPREGGRNGAWSIGSDPAATGTYVATRSNLCSGRGAWSGHYAQYGWGGWGTNWTAILQAPQSNAAVPFDARAYGAISFWAAFGPFNPADFAVPVGVTTMDNAWNGGVCSNTGLSCMDIYGTTVSPTHEWQRYVIPFDELKQAGWGVPQVPTIRKDQLVGFILWPRQDVDLWIDDIRFEPAASIDGGPP